MAAFLDLSLIPVIDEMGSLARQMLTTVEGGPHERRLEWMIDRLDELQHGALELWRDLLTEPAHIKAAGR